MSIRRSIIVLMIAALAVPAVFFSAQLRQTNADTTVGASELQQYTVERGDIELTVSALGVVEADQTAALSFALPGRVTAFEVEVGDVVVQGDVLARQDATHLEIALEQAQLALQLAELQKADLLAGPTDGEIAIAEANVESAHGAVASIANAVSNDQLRAAELTYEQAQQALADAQQARAFGNGTEEQVSLLDARVGEATFNAEIARLNLEALRSGSQPQIGAAAARVEQAERELERLLAGPTDAQIQQADAAISRAQIAVEQAQAALDRTLITSPFDGVVSAINLEEGALALPGVPVIELLDPAPLRMTAQIDELDVRQLARDQAARVRVDALPDLELTAVLEDIALIPNDDGGIVSYDVGLRLTEDDPRVRVGMTAEAAFIVEEQQRVLFVPNQFIRLDRLTGEAFVNLLQADGTYREIEITLGLQGETNSEVVDGVREGDVIVIDLSGDALPFFGG